MSETSEQVAQLIRDLKRTWAFHLYGDPSHPITGHTEEDVRIDFLAEIVGDYIIFADYTPEEMVEIFRQHPIPGFDILNWIKSKEASGDIDPHTERDW